MGKWKNHCIKSALLTALITLQIQVYVVNRTPKKSGSEMMLQAADGNADMTLRHNNFPKTFIRKIAVDITSPNHWVRLEWCGMESISCETGPFHSTPGNGKGENDCDCPAVSNRGRTNCTPKGRRFVEAFSDAMPTTPKLKYVTWFHSSREIAFHSHPELPFYPASHGCVRLSEHAAQLIHNNSVAGKTVVIVNGDWSPPLLGESSVAKIADK